MRPRSIRRRLPLSYAGIALLTSLALGALLLAALQLYYDRQERSYLLRNASFISSSLEELIADGLSAEALEARLRGFAFLTQTRVRLLDATGQEVLDSGPPELLAIELLGGVRPLGSPDERAADGAILRITGQDGPAPRDPEVTPGPLEEPAAPGQLPPQPRLFQPIDFPGFGTQQWAEDAERSEQRAMAPYFAADGTTRAGYVELSQLPAHGRAIVRQVAAVWAGASLLAVLLAASVGWMISRQVSAPLRSLAEVTARMAGGDLAARVELSRPEEVGALARSFNEMARRIQQTVLTLKSFIADAAHELHTPLTALRANLDLLLDEQDPARRRLYLERARSTAQRLESITDDLLDLSRIEAGAERPAAGMVDLTALLGELAELYASQAEQQGRELRLALPDAPARIVGDPALLRRAIGNLIDNALKFTPEGGAIEVALEERAGQITLDVLDSGIGIPEEDLPRLFERFHRGRNAAGHPGSGLGLAIVRAIVDLHGGHVAAKNTPEGGALFTLTWPGVEP